MVGGRNGFMVKEYLSRIWKKLKKLVARGKGREQHEKGCGV